MYFWFHKVLAIFCVAEQLPVSQKGLCSTQPVDGDIAMQPCPNIKVHFFSS
jgi:hypothetical protein